MLKSLSHASGPEVMAYEAAGGKLDGVSGLWSAHATCLRLNAVLARWHALLISSTVSSHTFYTCGLIECLAPSTISFDMTWPGT